MREETRICNLCLHEHHNGRICGHMEAIPSLVAEFSECQCTGSDRPGRVKIVISEDVWNFFCRLSDNRATEEVIDTVLRRVMGLFQ
jgi:hypothetical protein